MLLLMHRSSSRPVPFLFFLGAALILGSLFARDAFADHPYREIDVRLDHLDVRAERGELRVSYAIDRGSWRAIEGAHLRPRLNLYAPNGRRGPARFVHSVAINHREAVLVFDGHLVPRAETVEIRLSGERGRTRIVTTSYGADCSDRVRVAVARPHRDKPGRGHGHGHGDDKHDDHGHGHGDNRDVAIIEACSASTSWSTDFNACVQKGKRIGYDAPASIAACSAATSWSTDFQGCLDRAANIRHDRVATIHACSAATSWSTDFQACLDEARHLGGAASQVVDACSAATSWSTDFRQCLVSARRS